MLILNPWVRRPSTAGWTSDTSIRIAAAAAAMAVCVACRSASQVAPQSKPAEILNSFVAVPGAHDDCLLRLAVPTTNPDREASLLASLSDVQSVAWGRLVPQGESATASIAAPMQCGAYVDPESHHLFWFFQVDSPGYRGRMQCESMSHLSPTVEVGEPDAESPTGVLSLEHGGSVGTIETWTHTFGFRSPLSTSSSVSDRPVLNVREQLRACGPTAAQAAQQLGLRFGEPWRDVGWSIPLFPPLETSPRPTRLVVMAR